MTLDYNLKDSNFYKYYSGKAGLSEAHFEQLSSYFFFKEVAHGTFLLRAGEVSHHAFFVESGLLQSFSLDEKGGEHILQFAPENWIISDRASQYFNKPSDYYIKAIEHSIIVFVQPEFMEKASRESKEFACFLENSLQRNIYIQQKRINSLLAMNAKERYLSFMEMYPGLLLRVPQWMIASYLGITPESLSRVRRELLTDSKEAKR
ncbi:CRP-like cAMP-binding protein [Sphingobacterium allocomposti]|uniref:CRP-like cAMP-binding protein n=1 Tax=Sphingobacterium allocomposti TaxID=415956 RepID=A0A5S5D736_9SPHI|nr:Crp/Fnr family transcriptional regulator [Sphingobacterium composti Yoo et al. 2007 non Ten et al. 2007]TYP91771.1 CRP-like cAMP-binding protein [Sphingobacterium composti Yoo et al. 2007 non Ten et al. 2007]HLS93931.1 Crp/Fnr family transcriptional regulator [Sphingobacterium sp.]